MLHVLLWVATPTFHGALTWNLLMWSFVEPMVVPVLVVWCAVCQFPYLGILPKLGVVHAVPLLVCVGCLVLLVLCVLGVI